MAKLFLSNAQHDVALTKAMVILLEFGIGIPAKDIFCTASKGQGIKPGTGFVASIREALDQAACVVALMTEAYNASAFCNCELGAAWLAVKNYIPLIVPPITTARLEAVAKGMQVLKIGDPDDLDILRDNVLESLGMAEATSNGTPRWNTTKAEFLAKLPALEEAIVFAGPVPRAEHEKVKHQLQEYQDTTTDLQEQMRVLKQQYAELRKTKDRPAVAALERKYSSEAEAFDVLVKSARGALDSLFKATNEALFHHFHAGESYRPDLDDDSVDKAEEYGEVQEQEIGRFGPGQNAKVTRAMKALDDLKAWMDKASSDFGGWYEAEFPDAEWEFTNRGFWDKHLW